MKINIMGPLYFALLLITCFKPSWSSIQSGNLSMPEVSFDFSAINSDESELEYSSQLQEIDQRSSGWSAWSEWSACSRSCDGGVTHQLRTCRIGVMCKGVHVRYKICNMQSFVTLFAILAAASASVLVAPSAKIIQGPSSQTTVVGPDGSSISSVAPGGQIVHEESVGVVAGTAPVVAAAPAVAYSAPAVAYSAPAVAYSAHSVVAHGQHVVSPYAYSSAPLVSSYSAPVLSAYSAPAVSAYSAPVVSAYSSPVVSGVETVVAGPSGTIATGRTVAAAPLVSAW